MKWKCKEPARCTKFEKNYYQKYDAPKTIDAALADCYSVSGQLVNINSEAEYTFINKFRSPYYLIG